MKQPKKCALTAIALAIEECRKRLEESSNQSERIKICEQIFILGNTYISINNSSISKFDLDGILDMLDRWEL